MHTAEFYEWSQIVQEGEVILVRRLPSKTIGCFLFCRWLQKPFTSLFGPDPLPSRSAGDGSPLLQNLVGNSGEMQCLEEAEQQAEVSVDVPYPPLQLLI